MRARLIAALVAATLAARAFNDAPVAPRDGERRFEIVVVGDSTITLLTPGERWLRPGAYGIAVDPRQRDALVARLRLLSHTGDSSVALVTGQTTRLTTDFVAIFRRPPTPVLRQRTFWGGLAAGLLLGVSGALAATRLR